MSRSVYLLVALSLGLLAGTSRADDEQEARTLFEAGRAEYQQGKYADALRSFKESYRLARRSGLLFNIGVCQERLGQNDAAITTYELYVHEAPDAPDHELVVARIRFLKETGPGTPAERPPPVAPSIAIAPPVAPTIAIAPPALVTPAPPRRSRRGLVIGLSIAGVVLVGAAVGQAVGLTVGGSSSPSYSPSTLGTQPGSF